MNCDCKDWQENIDKVNAPLMLAAARSGWRVQYDGVCFRFCPWCSNLLKNSNASSVPEAPESSTVSGASTQIPEIPRVRAESTVREEE